MATITTRAGKGSPLTNTEVDNNFTNINTELGQKESASNKGVANGYASLDGSGKVPSTQLPSYVDDVVEAANLASLPGTGETGKIYVTLDTNKTYRWSGSAYVEISASPGSTDAVTEGSTNLYFTNARARSAISATGSLSYNSSTGVMSFTDAVTSVAGKTGAVTLTNSDVGLGNVENKSSATIRGEITSSNVTTALGFTPYNATNPSGYITSSALSSYLPLSGGTLTGDLTLNGNNTYFGGNVYLRANSDFNFLTNSGSAQNGRFRGIQVSSSYSGAVPENGILFGTDTTLVRGASTYGSLLVGGARNGYWGTMYDTGQGNAGWMTNGNASGYYAHGHGWKYYHESGVFYIHGGTYGGGAVYTALHSGNYTSYAPSLTGSGASGTWGINVTGGANVLFLQSLGSGSVNVNQGSTTVYRTETGNGSVVSYAPVLHVGGGDTMWQAQGTYGSSGNGTLYFRQGYAGSWGNWLTMLSSANYNSYSPTLTGTGASGTWGISISGNSATTSQRAFSGDISSGGQGRFTGWYSGGAATGQAAEIGMSSGQGYIFVYNRDTSTYGILNIAASSANLQFSGSTINVTAGSLQHGGNQVLHAGNYTSYALPLSGGTLTGAIRAPQITAGGSTNTDANLGVQGTAHITGTIYYGGTVGNVNSWSSISTSSSGTHTFSGSRFIFDRYGYGSQPLIDMQSSSITLSQPTYATNGITVNDAAANGRGINLYSGSPTSPTYGLFFAQTGNFGTYGAVSADWATYFTMNSTANRGWIFREVESLGNVAAISNQGNMTIRSHFEQGNNIARPNVSWSASSTSTGMVIFYLPGTTSNYGMVHMVFDIYEYNGNAVSTVIVGGHNWSTSWYNVSANVIGQCGKEVRLGSKDGRFCVVFGTSGSSWEYGTIVLRKIHNGGFYDNSMDMVGNWSTTQTTTESFTNITGDLRALRTPASFNAGGAITQAGNQVLHAGNYNSYSPTLTGGNASGTWGISVTGSASSLNFGGGYTAQMGDWGLRNTTPYGWIQFGPANGSHAHIYTDRSNIYFNVDLYTNGALQLHSSNYNSYAPTLTGGGASGTWGINVTGNAATATSADQIDGWGFVNTGSNSGVNADTIDSNGISYYTAGVTNFSGNSTDGALYSQRYSSSWQHQIAADYRSGQIALRGKNNGTWQSWRTVLDSGNYTSYSPSLTGSGASGTWSINVTGSAASLSGYYRADDWLRTVSDGYQFKIYGNSRTLIFRTDGSDNPHGGGGYSAIWYHGGSADGNRRMILGTSGDLWTNSYGWLHDYFASYSTANSRYSRKDTTNQWIKPYYEYGSYLTGETPANLRDQMGGGGLRVDFLHPSYTGSGGWNHVITWSGYNLYNMYQLGGHYDGGTGTDLWVRSEANHAGTSWTAWRKLLNSSNYSSYALPLSGGTTTGRITMPAWTTSGRNYSNEWIEFGNYSGLYSPLNGAHFYPNNASYGSWRVAGSRNGWHGLYFDSGSSLMVNSGEVGFYRDGHGWQMWWSGGTGYVHKGNPGGGTQATILDSSNYSSYALPLSGGTMTGALTMNTSANSVAINFGDSSKSIYTSSYWLVLKAHANEGIKFRNHSDVDTFYINHGTSNYDAWFKGNVTAYSDERVKSNWKSLDDGFVSRLANIKSGTFNRTDYNGRQAGVSAQSIRDVLPEVVTEDKDGMLSVAYGNAALVSAVELAKEIVNLKREIEMLKTKLH